jgi:anti-sigma factor RsiW
MANRDNESMELLSAYIDGELDPAEEARVNAFLASSAEGRKTVEQLNRTKAMLMSSPPVTAPADFLDAIEAQAEEAQAQFERHTFWRRSNPWAWVSSAATAALVVVAGLGMRPQKSIAFDTLVAAHMTFRTDTSLHQRVLRAAHYNPPAAESKNAAI